MRSAFWHRLPKIIKNLYVDEILIDNQYVKSMGLSERETFLRSIDLPNQLPSSERCNLAKHSCELIMVAAQKDFPLLHLTIPHAAKSLGKNFYSKITLVTPSKNVSTLLSIVQKLKTNVSSQIEIRTDEELLTNKELLQIEKLFKSRKGWVTQQILKLLCCLQSTSDFAYVVDADTLILRRRDFVNPNGGHALFPSEEFHSSYYAFLNKFGICSLSPSLTFVSHQIFLNTSHLKKFAFEYGFQDTTSILRKLELVPEDQREKSSICIDFEFYAQVVVRKNPSDIFFLKWGNLSLVNRGFRFSRIMALLLRPFFNSISFHSRQS